LPKIKDDLAGHGIVLEELGGTIPSVQISAKSGEGMDTLEDTILLVAEELELKTAVKVLW